MCIAWRSPAPPLSTLHRFLPYLFHPFPSIRASLHSALVPPLFTAPSLWSSSETSPDLPTTLTLSIAPYPSPLTFTLPGARRASPPFPTLSFLPSAFCLPTAAAPLTPVHLLTSPPPLPDAPIPDLLTWLLPLWSPSPVPSPLPSTVLSNALATEAPALASSLRDSPSHKALSSALGTLLSLALTLPGLPRAFLSVSPSANTSLRANLHPALTLPLPSLLPQLQWLHSLSRVFQGPPATRRDDRLLQDTLLALSVLLPHMTARDVTMLVAACMECLLPVLETAGRGEAGGREGLVDDALAFLSQLCEEVSEPWGWGCGCDRSQGWGYGKCSSGIASRD